MNQIELISGFCGVISKQKAAVKPSTLQIVVDFANKIIADEERPFVHAVPGMGLGAWLLSDDTGSSSIYMAHVLAGGPPADHAYPLDCDDFGRCYRFLRAVPDIAGHLYRLEERSPQWKALAEKWPALETLYAVGKDMKSGRAAVSKIIEMILKGVEK